MGCLITIQYGFGKACFHFVILADAILSAERQYHIFGSPDDGL